MHSYQRLFPRRPQSPSLSWTNQRRYRFVNNALVAMHNRFQPRHLLAAHSVTFSEMRLQKQRLDSNEYVSWAKPRPSKSP